jgi:hypothetical protein
MVKVEASRSEEPVDRFEVPISIGKTGVLVKLDLRNLVERAVIDLAVVAKFDADAVRQTEFADALSKVFELPLGERHAVRPNAVALGCMKDQRPPPTSDIVQAFARCQSEASANHVELRPLRVLKAHVRAREVGAGIHHALVQEERVEVIRNVVVELDECLVVALPRSAAIETRRLCCSARLRE